MGGELLPDWLLHLLKVPFYKERCPQHAGRYMTIYCATCMATPSCEKCWNAKHINDHDDHCQILNIRRASKRTAIDLQNIKGYWDTSLIQIYSINQKTILHLEPSPRDPDESSSCEFKCWTCTRKLMDSKYCFCSIACKVKSILQTQIDSDGMRASKRRKGIPHRAPLK